DIVRASAEQQSELFAQPLPLLRRIAKGALPMARVFAQSSLYGFDHHQRRRRHGRITQIGPRVQLGKQAAITELWGECRGSVAGHVPRRAITASAKPRVPSSPPKSLVF